MRGPTATEACTTWLVGVRDEQVLDVNYPIEASSRAEAVAIVTAPRVPRALGAAPAPGHSTFDVIVREEVRCERVFKVEARTAEEAGKRVLASEGSVHRDARNTEVLLTCRVLRVVGPMPAAARRGGRG